MLRYQESCFKVNLRLGSTQRALPESDPRVEEFRCRKAKGWGASLPSWRSPAPVFESTVYVAPVEDGPHPLQTFLTSVTFDLKPGLRTPREKHVQGSPYEFTFLADAKGECKMTLAFKDGEQIYRHQVPLKLGAEPKTEATRSWNVCIDPTYQLDGSDLPRSPGARGLISGVGKKMGKIIGRGSVTSDTSDQPNTEPDDPLDSWLADQEGHGDPDNSVESLEESAHRFAEAATGRKLTPPRQRHPEPEPEPDHNAVGHYTKKMFFRVEQRSKLAATCEVPVGGSEEPRWLRKGAVVEVLDTKWVGEDESAQLRVLTTEGWTTAVHGSKKYLKRDRKATRPSAPSESSDEDDELNHSVEGPTAIEPQTLDDSVPANPRAVRTVSQQLERDRQMVAEQNKLRAERERMENEERQMEAKRKREEIQAKREAEQKEKDRLREEQEAAWAEKRAQQEREARRLEKERAEMLAKEAEQRAAEKKEEARRKAEEQRRKREEEEKATEKKQKEEAQRIQEEKQKAAALKREQNRLKREREGKGGTLIVSVGHLSLVDDDIEAYVPLLKIICDQVEGKAKVCGGQHRAIRPPELVPYDIPGGTDFVFAVQPSCKHLVIDLWDESMLGARFNTVLGSKQVPLHRVRCADSVWPDHYQASAFGGTELPRDSGTWSALSEEFELKDAKSGKTKGNVCLTMRWAPWPDEGVAEDENVKVEFKEPGPLGEYRDSVYIEPDCPLVRESHSRIRATDCMGAAGLAWQRPCTRTLQALTSNSRSLRAFVQAVRLRC